MRKLRFENRVKKNQMANCFEVKLFVVVVMWWFLLFGCSWNPGGAEAFLGKEFEGDAKMWRSVSWFFSLTASQLNSQSLTAVIQQQ